MGFYRRSVNWFYLLPFNFLFGIPLFAAEQGPSRPYPWPWRPEMCWSDGWWIFPFMFFLLMIVLCSLMMRKNGRACFRRPVMKDPESLGPIKRFWGDSQASALEILNRRYATGEIDKKEYEEKKTEILSSKQPGL